MSSIPGMSDGRSQGLGSFLASGEFNKLVMREVMAKNHNEYRQIAQSDASKIIEAQRKLSGMMPDDTMGCQIKRGA